jgi:hypothetical protein
LTAIEKNDWKPIACGVTMRDGIVHQGGVISLERSRQAAIDVRCISHISGLTVFDNEAPMIKRSAPWNSRSPVSRWAHVFERTGLALAGGSCGLFVAAHVARNNIDLIGSGAAILGMMLYGAAGFYLGIDLPPAPEHLVEPRQVARTDIVELLSAAGTFLTAAAAVVSVSAIILDEITGVSATFLIGVGWAIGATMQIAAGIIARVRRPEQTEP